MGEVLKGDINWVAPYQNYVTGVFNFPIYFDIKKVWGKEKKPMKLLTETLKEEHTKFNNMDLLGVFVDNHDLPRFLSEHGDIQSFKAALIFTLTIRGIPFVYYGTEHAFSGGADPLNREMMQISNLQNRGSEIYKMMATVIELRKQHEIWDLDEQFKLAEDTVLAYTRGDLLIVLTNQNDQVTRSIPDLSHPDGTYLCNVLKE